MDQEFDVIVAGGGPAGATAALELVRAGRSVLLIDREGRIKPCGGALPVCAMKDFDIDPDIVVARISAARMIGPSGRSVSMEIGDRGYVAMVDRESFDPWLRDRAETEGAHRIAGTLDAVEQMADGRVRVGVADKADGEMRRYTARALIGADGANSAVRRAVFGAHVKPKYVFAYHEIVEAPAMASDGYRPASCDVVYDGRISPDFYGWVFPHGEHASIGCGTGHKGFDMKAATAELRRRAGLDTVRTIRREGAPLPLKPLRRWDNGRNVLLIGDAAGVVAPSSGEGIWYAMMTGRMGAQAVGEFLQTGRASALAGARKRFMKDHGRVFFVLGLLQAIWYRNDKRREQFVKMCADADVQRLTWESYLHKRLVRRDPLAHLRVLWKDLRELMGLSPRVAP